MHPAFTSATLMFGCALALACEGWPPALEDWEGLEADHFNDHAAYSNSFGPLHHGNTSINNNKSFNPMVGQADVILTTWGAISTLSLLFTFWSM